MDSGKIAAILKDELTNELNTNILQYWMDNAPAENGGFIGRILSDNTRVLNAPRGSVLNARILWTFSAAYNQLRNPEYLVFADIGFDYITKYFIDKKQGGVFWMLDSEGNPLDTKKQIYALAFTIYALSEYYIATNNRDALAHAIDLFEVIEKYSFDKNKNGYFEAYSHDWKLLTDFRLSDKDANEAKTMNTHLHIMEAYTLLYKIWPDDFLKKQLTNLVSLHFNRILNKEQTHFNLFFDEAWNLKSHEISYGHDIEGAWLMQEAAAVLGNIELIKQAEEIAVKIADATLNEGIAADGAILNEGTKAGVTNDNRDWWPQAEAMVGFVNAWQNTKDPKYLTAAFNCWFFTKNHIISHTGEWWWGVNAMLVPQINEDKVGPWKCPYHNSRACIEILKRVF